jgi:hypothetical protein
MWSGSNKVWLQHRKDIMAAETADGKFLADYLRFMTLNRSYISNIEVVDLQRYRVIKEQNKVRIALAQRIDVPFVFIIGKN